MGPVKGASIGNSPFHRKRLHLFGQKLLSERERGAVEIKVITSGKIVLHNCCLLSLNIRRKKDFDTSVGQVTQER